MTTNNPAELKPAFNQPRNVGLLIGIVAIVLGAVAILIPQFSTLIAETWLALILISVGASNAFYAINRRPEGFGWRIFLGVLYIVTGILLFAYPLPGVLTLTLLMGSFFLTEGVFESILAFRLRPQKNWGWVFANGIITFVLGLLVWFQWPQDASWAIGTFVGISVLSTGVSRVMLSLSDQPPLPADPTTVG
jgi:uncharacterized membrane protein HdeD (DUF308 family)